MTDPVRNTGVCLLPQSSFVLQWYNHHLFYLHSGLWLIRNSLAESQGIFSTIQSFVVFVPHLHHKAPGRYNKGLVSCRRSSWGQGDYGTGCLSGGTLSFHGYAGLSNEGGFKHCILSLVFLILLGLVESIKENIYEPRSQMLYT